MNPCTNHPTATNQVMTNLSSLTLPTASSYPVDCVYACSVTSVISDSFAAPWAVACQAPLSMGFSRQEYWSGLPFPPPGDLLDPGIEPVSPVSPSLQTDS